MINCAIAKKHPGWLCICQHLYGCSKAMFLKLCAWPVQMCFRGIYGQQLLILLMLTFFSLFCFSYLLVAWAACFKLTYFCFTCIRFCLLLDFPGAGTVATFSREMPCFIQHHGAIGSVGTQKISHALRREEQKTSSCSSSHAFTLR